MTVPASIVIPTRARPAYLEVALSSIAPEAARLGVEVLVVDDAGPSKAARELAERFGARYEPHARPLGLNVARNTGVERSAGELVVFVDDDVRVGPGWLSALLDAAREHPDVDVFTGPIRARLEGASGWGSHSCGRERPPITTLEFGERDTDADYAWGANMAIRREALERVGPFDVSLEHGGDEQEWQERLRADTPGARVLYVGRAAVEHRRVGADACLRSLSRAGYTRGRAARRFDARRGRAPSLARELLTLVGCVGHVVRRRCPAGLTMVAHSSGRLREGLRERRAAAAVSLKEPLVDPSPDDFLSGASGTVGGFDAVRREALDEALDAWQLLSAKRLRLGLAARHAPPLQRVLALGVERPERRELAAAMRAELLRSRHDVELHTCAPGGRGKFENLNMLLAERVGRDLMPSHDWLLVLDDDVELPRGFLDRFLFLCERFSLTLAQPAHRLQLACGVAGHAPARGQRGARDELRGDRPGDRVREPRVPGAAAVPRAAHGLGSGCPLGGARARARVALRRARRGRDRPPCRARGRGLRARGRGRRGALVPRRASLSERARGRPHADDASRLVSAVARSGPRVAVVAEFYPSLRDPVLGVWAHRQALAARDAGAELEVLVLHRLVPPRASLAAGPGGARRALAARLREPRRQVRDGLAVTYVPFVSPSRDRSYAAWGAWAAPSLALALRRLARSFPFELVHAHNAVPAADAVRRARLRVPMVVSVHGGDVLYTARRDQDGADAVARGLGAAALVLANSHGIAELSRACGAGETRVLHLGTELPSPQSPAERERREGSARAGAQERGRSTDRARSQSLVTVAHLVARKRHADVLRALAVLTQRHPTLRYTVIGDGPERFALEGLAMRLGVAERVDFLGQLAPEEALERARGCTLFVMPSTEEAFGVAYVEAMAAGVPAIGCRGEPGPEEIAAAGDGFMLVPPGDIERLTQRIDELLSDPQRLREAGLRARATVAANFTWRRCGEETVAAYEHVLGRDRPAARTRPAGLDA